MDGDTGWNDQCDFALAVTTANLTIKRDPDGLLVWATDLQTAAPLANIPVTVYDYNGEATVTSFTDEEGLATLPPISAQVTLPDGIQQMSAFASVVAQSDDVYGIWTSNQRYGAGGGATYLYTDRAVYRPGETVYFRGVMRGGEDIAYTLPAIDSIEAHTYGYQTDDLLDVELPVSPFGTFSGQFTIPDDYPLGGLMIAVGAPVFYECGECRPDYGPSTSVEIADYRVPEIKVNLTAQKPALIEGETLNVLIDAQYYSGGGVPEAPVQYYVTSEGVPFTYTGPGRYRFEPDPSCCEGQRWFFRRDEFDTGYRTDMNGQLVFAQDMSGFVPRTSRLTVEATVNDATGLAVSGRTSVLLHPAELYVGLNMQNYFARAEESTLIDLIVVDPDSRPAAGEHVRLEVTEIRWTRTEIRDEYGRWQWAREVIPVNEQFVVSGVGGTAYAEFTPSNAGIYNVLATVTDSAGRENRSMLTFYVSGDQAVLWGQQKSHDLTIIPDQSSYRPGDTAQVLIAVPFVERGDTWLLISAERHERFVTEVIKATGTTLIYELPITDAHAPNVHITVTMVQGAGPDGLPDYRQGAVSLNVEPVSRRLQVEVLSSSTAYPGETLTIDLRVTDSDGKPMQAELGVSLVDQAVLALRDLPDRPLESVFYSPRGNAISTTTGMSALLELIYTYESEPGYGHGGGGYGQAPLVLRDTFVTTPLWQPHVVTDADGRASVSVDMPDNLTAWRLGVKAITTDTLVGDVSSEVVSRLPFWVQPAAPRFFVVGDHVTLAAIVHNGTDTAQTATVSLDARGMELLDPISQDVIIDAGGQVRVEWRAIPGETEAVDLTFSAVAASGLQDAVKPRLGEETLIPVYRFTARDTVGTSGILFEQGERTERIILPEGIDGEQGVLTVEAAPSLSALAIDSINALSTDPRADIEYLISRFYPNAVMYNALLKLNVDADEVSTQLEEALATAIPLLMAAQNADGGWGWFGDMESDMLVTAYALLGLSEAHFADFELPRQAIDRAAHILRASLTRPSLNTPRHELDRQAFILYALSHCRRLGACIEDDARLPAALNWLVENRDELSTAARAYLLMSMLEIAPESLTIDTLIADLQGTVVLSAGGAHWEEPDPSNWGSTTRTTALTTAALIRAEPDSPLLPSAVRWLVTARSSGHRHNTQEIVWSLVAFADWMAHTGELQANYDYLIALNKDILIDASVTPARIGHTETASIPLADIFSTKPNALTVTHGKGAGVLYYTAALDVQIPAGDVDAVNRGISVTRDYFVGDAELPALEARVGDIVTVRLTIIVGQDSQYFMLDDRLPAGLEAVDLRILTSTRAASAPTLTRDDSRWYWGWWWFDRTELRDEGAVLYADVLPRGTYVFSYQARAVTPGTFQAIPAYAQQIYFPDVFGRSDGALFTIQNSNGFP